MKPHIGLALGASRLSKWALFGALAVLLAASVVDRQWPAEWLHAVGLSPHHHAPIAHWYGGPLLLLFALRWRRREARIGFALACVPQLLLFYDQLPLALIPQTDGERRTFVWLSWAALVGWVATNLNVGPRTLDVRDAAPWIIAFIYLPSLVMVLRRPNEGEIPTWLERVTIGWPTWIKGGPATSLG